MDYNRILISCNSQSPIHCLKSVPVSLLWNKRDLMLGTVGHLISIAYVRITLLSVFETNS